MPDKKKRVKRRRTAILDSLRGLTVINMVLYHAIWDLVYLFGMDWSWYEGTGAYIWQQCICCTFILLSGFCSAVSRRPFLRGGMVFGVGAVVTIVTAVFMPENIVLFGVLTMLGSCMLLMPLLQKALVRVPAFAGMTGSLFLFLLTRHIDNGYLGFCGTKLFTLPRVLYQNYLTAYFGFCPPGFYSTDYFPLFPWLFLFLTGYFLYRLAGKSIMGIRWKGIAPLNWIGQHALEIYAVHQPIIYAVLYIIAGH